MIAVNSLSQRCGMLFGLLVCSMFAMLAATPLHSCPPTTLDGLFHTQRISWPPHATESIDEAVQRLEPVILGLAESGKLIIARAQWPARYEMRIEIMDFKHRIGAYLPIHFELRAPEGQLLAARPFDQGGWERPPRHRPEPTFPIPWECVHDGFIHLNWALVSNDGGQAVDRTPVHAIKLPVELIHDIQPLLDTAEIDLQPERVDVYLNADAFQSRVHLNIQVHFPEDVAFGATLFLLQNNVEIGRTTFWHGSPFIRVPSVLFLDAPITIRRTIDRSKPVVAVLVDSEELALRALTCTKQWRGAVTVDARLR